MGREAKTRNSGYVCPVKGCKKKKTSLYNGHGIFYHLIDYHFDYLIKKLNIKKGVRENNKIEIIK